MLPLVAGGLVALVALSYIVEALRPQPVPPEHLDWAPDLTVSYADVGGARLRYVTAGQGPALVLLAFSFAVLAFVYALVRRPWSVV